MKGDAVQMGRMGASEYYNDNLRRLLREDPGVSAAGQRNSTPIRESDIGARRDVELRPIRTAQTRDIYQTGGQRPQDDAAQRPKVPMYGSDSYRIGERDERRSKIDGVYGRRQPTPAEARTEYETPIAVVRGVNVQSDRQRASVQNATSSQRNGAYGQTVQRTAAQSTYRAATDNVHSRREAVTQRTAPGVQYTSGDPRQMQTRTRDISSPLDARTAQPSRQRTEAQRRPDRMQTNPGSGMSYDARYGGDIKPTSATFGPRQTAQPDTAHGAAAKKSRERLDPEAEAEIRENRRLYKEYVDNERRTMDRAERDRRRMEEYYAARSGRFARKLKEFFILAAAFAVTLCLISIIVYKLLFVVSEVTVYGGTTVDADSVIDASGVECGDNLYSFSATAASSAVTLRYPIIKSVAVKRTIPNKVAFTVTEDEPVFYCDIFGEVRMLSADLRVMGVKDDSYEGLIKLKLPALEYAVDGREVQYADGKQNRYVAEIISAVLSSSLADRMTMMDLTHSYDITMVCDGKYLLSFGENEEMDIKIKIAVAVLEDDLFSGGNKATVDLSDTSQTSVIIDNQLDLE